MTKLHSRKLFLLNQLKLLQCMYSSIVSVVVPDGELQERFSGLILSMAYCNKAIQTHVHAHNKICIMDSTEGI